MSEGWFKKGHENYFKGKKVDRDVFYGCLERFLAGEITLEKAAEIVGVSIPTLRKRYNAVFTGEEIPEKYWFYAKEQDDPEPEKAEKTAQLASE